MASGKEINMTREADIDSPTWVYGNAEAVAQDRAIMAPEDFARYYYADGTLKPFAFALGLIEKYRLGGAFMTIAPAIDNEYKLTYTVGVSEDKKIKDTYGTLAEIRKTRAAILSA
jgi:hypothetical protein